jgi:lipoprotein-anchoring transpeptidase ErfK/SrfK
MPRPTLRPLPLCLVASALVLPVAAQAQAADDPFATGTTTRAAPGSLGGGFLELILTGRDPTPVARAYRPQPLLPAAAPRAVPPQLAPRPQLAALPDDAETHRSLREVEPRFRRQTVDYDGPHAPGTVVVDTPNRYLYLVQPGGRALRYGIGVGRPGFEWAGMKSVTMKREWPDWRPPAQMLKRRPDLPTFMAGGPDNPLGARALYLGSSLYRIHGTNEPWSIGQAVSSGCIRMTNEDVVDLYRRVGVGAKVMVI